MSRLLAALAAAALAAPGAARAGIITYVAELTPEAPGATGAGTALLTYDPSASTLRLQVTFSGLTGTTTVAHIHGPTPTPFSGTAGVMTRLPSFVGFPTGVTAGSFDRTYDLLLNREVGAPANAFWNPTFVTNNGGTFASAEAALVGALNTGRAYLNVHTSRFPGGEINGFFTPTPEPASLALVGVGAAGLAGARLRRRAARA